MLNITKLKVSRTYMYLNKMYLNKNLTVNKTDNSLHLEKNQSKRPHVIISITVEAKSGQPPNI